MRMPRVSVVIDTYNYGQFVEEAVDSALAQDFPKDEMEILVVDDGSTDDTAERIAKYGDSIRYLRKQNGGQASAINFGTAHAKGELVAFLDGDDVWVREKLRRAVEEFDKNPNVVMVYNRYCFWDSRSGRVSQPPFADVAGDVVRDWHKLREYCGAPTSSLTFRRNALERLMPIPESLVFMADTPLIALAIFLGPVAVITECLTKNRVHGENLWFAEGQPSREVLRRRVKARKAAINAIRDWLRANGPRSLRPQARSFLRRWRLIQDEEAFRLDQPGRLRQFLHLCRDARMAGPIVSKGNLTFRWAYAFAVLIAGDRARHVQRIRVRVKILKRRFQQPSRQVEPTPKATERS
ncbi:MAG: glycosyltransferase family 2 protein [Candidatus Acidiferrales bacterium]